MALPKITIVSGKAVSVHGDDIDTDRIIPARFMRCVTFEGLARYLFYDVRFDGQGRSLDHPLDRPEHRGASILISGRNFGCGSSREHAPQALKHFGFRAILAEGFAEIFFGNCTTLGIPCATASHEDIQRLLQALRRDPEVSVAVDLRELQIRWEGQGVPFRIKEGARRSLLEGAWDALGGLLEAREQARAFEAALEYRFPDGVVGRT